MKRQKIDEFVKETETHEIKLVVGIDPKPREAVNPMFYIRMESKSKKTGKTRKAKSIWLSLNEMAKLSVLLTVASRFWTERLEKGSEYSEERIIAS